MNLRRIALSGDLAARILQAAIGGSSTTKIMSESFVEYCKLRKTLELLTNEGLLEVSNDFREFKTSSIGLNCLDTCNYTKRL